MSTEYRRITFNNIELRSALESYLAQNNGSIPKGDISSIKSTRKSNDFFYELTLFNHAKQKGKSMLVEQRDSVEALIEFCIGNGIALPRAARKETRDVDNQMCLEIFLD